MCPHQNGFARRNSPLTSPLAQTSAGGKAVWRLLLSPSSHWDLMGAPKFALVADCFDWGHACILYYTLIRFLIYRFRRYALVADCFDWGYTRSVYYKVPDRPLPRRKSPFDITAHTNSVGGTAVRRLLLSPSNLLDLMGCPEVRTRCRLF